MKLEVSEKTAIEFLDESPPVILKKILDFGCGRGHTAVELKRRGATVIAHDISKSAGLLAVEAGIQFRTIVPTDWKPDIIWCSHMLEHVPDAIGMLKYFRTLADTLWLAVPNIYNGYVLGHVQNYTLPLLVEHLRLSQWDVINGSFKRVRGHLWARVKKAPTLQIFYPEPMNRLIKESGRCPAEKFEEWNW